jgi:hypothetical protein
MSKTWCSTAWKGTTRSRSMRPSRMATSQVNGGGPGASDVLMVNGAAGVDELFTVNPGFGNGNGSVQVDALNIPYTGIEHILLDAKRGDTDTLTVNDDWRTTCGPSMPARSSATGFRSTAASRSITTISAVTLVNGFGADQFVIHPTHLIGTAALTVIADGGAVRDDVVTIIATEADDVVTSTADTITVNGSVPVTIGNNGAGFAEVQLLALGGDDHITLSLGLPGVRKFVDGGAGNDFIDMSGTVDAIIFGGDGDDYIIGSPTADFIDGGRGNDIIFGGGGNDVIYGGEGNDIIIGGTGADQMFGGDRRRHVHLESRRRQRSDRRRNREQRPAVRRRGRRRHLYDVRRRHAVAVRAAAGQRGDGRGQRSAGGRQRHHQLQRFALGRSGSAGGADRGHRPHVPDLRQRDQHVRHRRLCPRYRAGRSDRGAHPCGSGGSERRGHLRSGNGWLVPGRRRTAAADQRGHVPGGQHRRSAGGQHLRERPHAGQSRRRDSSSTGSAGRRPSIGRLPIRSRSSTCTRRM